MKFLSEILFLGSGLLSESHFHISGCHDYKIQQFNTIPWKWCSWCSANVKGSHICWSMTRKTSLKESMLMLSFKEWKLWCQILTFLLEGVGCQMYNPTLLTFVGVRVGVGEGVKWSHFTFYVFWPPPSVKSMWDAGNGASFLQQKRNTLSICYLPI